MTVWGRFVDQRQDLKTLDNGEIRLPERLIVISMDLVRYLTRVSGFLYISSMEKDRYFNFEPASFTAPGLDWVPPYPYCNGDVLFPVEHRNVEDRTGQQLHRSPFNIALEKQSMKDLMPANDSLGG
jgi:hypothetical protein